MEFGDRRLSIDELCANDGIVSAHKYGFFLCRAGSARILLGTGVYRLTRNNLCIYTPDTFFRILEKSPDLSGVLEEDSVLAYYPAVSLIDIRKRLQIRNAPCIVVSDEQADTIVLLVGMMREAGADGSPLPAVRDAFLLHMRYALCLKILDIYFCNAPIEALPEKKENAILNKFLVSVYENCHLHRTVRHYAEEQHLSPYYFSSIIKRLSGKSALQWIDTVTMTVARQYLDCSQMSIKEISERLNFADQSTFGRYFKRGEGCSPSEYREKKSKIYK